MIRDLARIIGEAEMLKMREFVRNCDEQRWVSVLNAAYGKLRDWRTITAEEHFKEERGSNFAFDGRWIAEPNGSARAKCFVNGWLIGGGVVTC